jgi:hypothetical protein
MNLPFRGRFGNDTSEIGRMRLAGQLQHTIIWSPAAEVLVASTSGIAASGTSTSPTGKYAIHSLSRVERRRQTWPRFNVATSAVEPSECSNWRSDGPVVAKRHQNRDVSRTPQDHVMRRSDNQ